MEEIQGNREPFWGGCFEACLLHFKRACWLYNARSTISIHFRSEDTFQFGEGRNHGVRVVVSYLQIP